MGQPRALTADEARAIRRIERAIKSLPPTIGLYFHGDTASVLEWPASDQVRGDESLDVIQTPQCRAGDF